MLKLISARETIINNYVTFAGMIRQKSTFDFFGKCNNFYITTEFSVFVEMFAACSLTLAPESPSASGKPNTHDVRIINLAHISDVSVIKESQDPAQIQLTNLNQNKVRVGR